MGGVSHLQTPRRSSTKGRSWFSTARRVACRAIATIRSEVFISRVGLAVSNDGINFSCEPKPVYYPGNDAQEPFEKAGASDPRVVTAPDGTFIIVFTQDAAKGAMETRAGHLQGSPYLDKVRQPF